MCVRAGVGRAILDSTIFGIKASPVQGSNGSRHFWFKAHGECRWPIDLKGSHCVCVLFEVVGTRCGMTATLVSRGESALDILEGRKKQK